jgi:hypothetical protein
MRVNRVSLRRHAELVSASIGINNNSKASSSVVVLCTWIPTCVGMTDVVGFADDAWGEGISYPSTVITA